ncbi:hypothetical protein Pcinc_026956 [Petrolisthes cinctipes]|uniref:phosphoethanolamine N-methyltransferase n=1 Tax=Petrolisthes cinctipes TaxID=88211 RepID=A0AAE1F5Q5_PETCI|nr:hypothetical protein Pcinc_026956 [Petrolisthes cinctipes]
MSTDESSVMVKRKTFWEQQEPSEEAMIQAEIDGSLADDDAHEIMGTLPDFRGKRVLDLAAGIGRFTARLAKKAQWVTAVDLCEAFITENRARNKRLNNITYICHDVINLCLPAGSVDLVFSNWLFKYLTEEEVAVLLTRALSWLVPGGHFFFRESCFQSMASVQRANNPTIYRQSQWYTSMLSQARGCCGNGESFYFTLLCSKNMLAYIKYRDSGNQVCFLAQKRIHCQPQQPGGGNTCCPSLHPDISHTGMVLAASWACLEKGQKMLEVGCGVGESTFLLAERYGVHVHGLDLSPSLVHSAIDTQVTKTPANVSRKVQFEVNTNMQPTTCDSNTFHHIYCQPNLLHKIPHLHHTLAQYYKLLRPGGKLLVGDYCRGTSQYRPNHYMCGMGSVEGVIKLLKEAGFKGVTSQDLTQELLNALHDNNTITYTNLQQKPQLYQIFTNTHTNHQQASGLQQTHTTDHINHPRASELQQTPFSNHQLLQQISEDSHGVNQDQDLDLDQDLVRTGGLSRSAGEERLVWTLFTATK